MRQWRRSCRVFLKFEQREFGVPILGESVNLGEAEGFGFQAGAVAPVAGAPVVPFFWAWAVVALARAVRGYEVLCAGAELLQEREDVLVGQMDQEVPAHHCVDLRNGFHGQQVDVFEHPAALAVLLFVPGDERLVDVPTRVGQALG